MIDLNAEIERLDYLMSLLRQEARGLATVADLPPYPVAMDIRAVQRIINLGIAQLRQARSHLEQRIF